MNVPKNTTFIETDNANVHKEGDQSRSEMSTSTMQATKSAVEPLEKRPNRDWPDEIELLKRIEWIDAENAWRQDRGQTENHDMPLSDSESKPERVIRYQTYGNNEMVSKYVDSARQETRDFEVGQMKRLTIVSAHLREVFHEVVEFYPAENLDEYPLVFSRPYTFLFHALPSLKDLCCRMDPKDCKYVELCALLFHCERHLVEPFGVIRSMLDAGHISFLALEALFRPGIKLLAKDKLGGWQVLMCVEARTGRSEFLYDTPVCTVFAWCLSWDNVVKKFLRRMLIFKFDQFHGARRIDTLQIFPFDYFGNGAARDAMRVSLVRRGHQWLKFMSGQASCWMHEGACLVIDSKAPVQVAHQSKNQNSDTKSVSLRGDSCGPFRQLES